MLKSPGYGSAIGYPGVMQCTWTLRAPTADRSITIVFEAFQLEQNKDFLTVSYHFKTKKAFHNMGFAKMSSGIIGQRRPRSDCAFAQSGLGLR